MTDAEIIEHIRQDRFSRAMKGLYRYFPAAKAYIRANSGSREDAEDLYQDALVILYKNVRESNWTLTSSLGTWLLAVVKNCWRQELRRRSKMPAGDHTDIATEEADTEPAFRIALAAFGLLAERCKQLLTLFYIHKKSMQEIAKKMALKDEQVAKNQKYRCMEKAKEFYLLLAKNEGYGA